MLLTFPFSWFSFFPPLGTGLTTSPFGKKIMCYVTNESSRVEKIMKKKKIFVTGGKHVNEVLTLLQAPSAFSVKSRDEKLTYFG